MFMFGILPRIPIRPGFREIGESRFGRDRELAGIYASINRDQDRDRDSRISLSSGPFLDL